MSKVAHTPQLRFPEFSGDWEEKKLSDISDVRDGTHESPKYVLDGFPLITSKNLLSNGSIDFENINLVSEEDYTNINKRSKVDINDILFGMIGTIGNPVIVKETGFAIKNVALIKQQKELLNKFMIFYLSGNSIAKQFYIENTGGTQKFLALGVIRSLKIKFPPDTEQQKIAAFLTAVDNKIEQLIKKQELLGEYKKGLMQQIFSQAIRFKASDGSDFPDWEEKKLGDLFSGIKGRGLSKGDITIDGLNKCILYGELYTTYPEVIKNIVSRTNSDDGVKSQAGDLLVPCSTTTTGIDLADVTAINEDNVLLGGDMSILRLKKDGDSIFFAYYLTHYKKFDLAKYGQGSTIVHLYYSHFKKIDLKFPSSVEEQTKIANFLSSIDNKIEQVGKQLDESKQFKKALLQQMFV